MNDVRDTPAARPPVPAAGNPLVRYLANLSGGRFALWCYFIYWCVIAARYFDPRPTVWLTSLGLALIIGLALYLNTTRSGKARVRLGAWPTFRLFLTPFCVSSFAALVKDRGFVLIFSPDLRELGLAAAICAVLAVAAVVARRGTALSK
ncbi:MAG TPA: hypothetical protein VF796_07500 [Humisphaera sp.]